MGKKPAWENVLLTDSGFFNPFDLTRPLAPIVERFTQMAAGPFSQARVLFIPAAACDEEAKHLAAILYSELIWLCFSPENIVPYMLDRSLPLEEALSYDVMFVTGGWCEHLLKLIQKVKFQETVRAFVFANKVYVGVSAGSVIATPNIMGTFERFPSPAMKGLGLVHAYLDCHCDMRPGLTEKALSFPHVLLHFNQALAVNSAGYERIEVPSCSRAIDWSSPPVMGVDVYKLDAVKIYQYDS